MWGASQKEDEKITRKTGRVPKMFGQFCIEGWGLRRPELLRPASQSPVFASFRPLGADQDREQLTVLEPRALDLLKQTAALPEQSHLH